MNKRTTIVSLTLAILLVGSIAYAAEKRKQSRLAPKDLDSFSEDALAAELLETTEEHQVKVAHGDDVTSPATINEMVKNKSMAKHAKK